MSTEHVSFEERRYTRQHDRVLHAVVQQIHQLTSRVAYLENVVDPDDSVSDDQHVSNRVTRGTSTALAEEITSIGASLQAVIASLDAPRPERAPALSTDSDKPVIVDLSSQRSRQRGWRADKSRQPGWQPVATRKGLGA